MSINCTGGDFVAKGIREVKIRTESYVHVGDKLVNTDDLTQEQKLRLAGWIVETLCNEIYRGEFVVTAQYDKVYRGEDEHGASDTGALFAAGKSPGDDPDQDGSGGGSADGAAAGA